jgi:hypothetical protein
MGSLSTASGEIVSWLMSASTRKDLNVNSLEHAKILRHRFAHALLAEKS